MIIKLIPNRALFIRFYFSKMITLKEQFKDVVCGINAEKIDYVALTDTDHNIINEQQLL